MGESQNLVCNARRNGGVSGVHIGQVVHATFIHVFFDESQGLEERVTLRYKCTSFTKWSGAHLFHGRPPRLGIFSKQSCFLEI